MQTMNDASQNAMRCCSIRALCSIILCVLRVPVNVEPPFELLYERRAAGAGARAVAHRPHAHRGRPAAALLAGSARGHGDELDGGADREADGAGDMHGTLW